MAEIEIDRDDVYDRKKWKNNGMKRKSSPIGLLSDNNISITIIPKSPPIHIRQGTHSHTPDISTHRMALSLVHHTRSRLQ